MREEGEREREHSPEKGRKRERTTNRDRKEREREHLPEKGRKRERTGNT